MAAGLTAGHRPQAVFLTADTEALRHAESDPALRDAPLYVVTDRVAAKISTLETAPAVMAVFAIPEAPSLASLRSADALVLYADGIADPGNMGTLVRAAAAFGAAALIAGPVSVDLFGAKVVRGSMGAIFALPVYRDLEVSEAVAQLEAPHVYGLAAHGGAPLAEAELARPALLCVGAERAGLSAGTQALVSATVTIPLAPAVSGAVESLNAGVAGAIALYEFARREATAASTARRGQTTGTKET